MEITPAQLDAIATKLLGWPNGVDPGTIVRSHLNPDDPADAMLVLEAMGRWCIEQNMTEVRHKPVLEGPIYKSDGYVCCLMTYDTKKGWWLDIHAKADTTSAAIFACAAQLVGRM